MSEWRQAPARALGSFETFIASCIGCGLFFRRRRRMHQRYRRGVLIAVAGLALGGAFAQSAKDPKPGGLKTPTPKETGDQTYTIPIVAEESFKAVMDRDVRDKPGVMRRQQS